VIDWRELYLTVVNVLTERDEEKGTELSMRQVNRRRNTLFPTLGYELTGIYTHSSVFCPAS
jgi:hypothetical protein